VRPKPTAQGRHGRRPEISNTICNYLGGLMQDCRWLTLTLGEVLAFLQ
jgi:hypothetical protein